MHFQMMLFLLFLLFTFHPQNGNATSPPKVGQKEITTDEENPKSYTVKISEEFDQLESFEDLVTDAIDWAHKVGLIYRKRDHTGVSDIAEITPFSLFPSPFPGRLFVEAQSIQKTLQLLYFRVSQDYAFLTGTLREAARTDNYLRLQLDLFEEVQRRGIKQPITLLLQRSDYMCHVNKKTGEYELKQVEVNIGPIGGNISAQAVRQIHGRVFSKLGLSDANLPENRAGAAIGESLAMAWEHFGDPSAVIVITSTKENHGHFVLRHIQYEIERASENKIKVIRLTMEECGEKLILDPNDHSLRINGRKVGVFFVRKYIYERDWTPEKHWAVRRKVELSTAIKPFGVSIHLAGSKKVQQALALPGMLERFLPDVDKEKVDAVRKTFAGLWGLEKADEETRAVIEEAIANPGDYVLKTNRDGGGNNFWDEQLAEKLRGLPASELSALVLMQKLTPLGVKNVAIRPLNADHSLRNMASELGIVGYFLGNAVTMETIANEQKGHLLRTKFAEFNEGGVGIGSAVHDSPFLF